MERKISKIGTENLNDFLLETIDVQISLLQNHFDICKIVINSILGQEVDSLAGKRYSHDKPNEGQFSRWGHNPSSVKIGTQKMPIQVPRVMDNVSGENVVLENFQKIGNLPEQTEGMVQSVLHGLSMRDYQHTAEKMLGNFGLSAASISREFVAESAEALKEFNERTFEEIKFVSLFIDGKHMAGSQMIIVLGVTDKGQKIPIGISQTTTENHKAIKQLLSDLIARGLDFEDGLLVVIDGAKGLKKAVEETFGDYALIQRCQWHKRENVVSYLKLEKQEEYRKKLQKAYAEEEYDLAKLKLIEVGQELKKENIQAYNSLMEGFEETLTIKRIGLNQFSRSFSTTNCIESLNSQVGKFIRKVKRWQTPDQRLRWTAMGLLEAEQRMKKVSGFEKLPEMVKILKTTINEIKLAQKTS